MRRSPDIHAGLLTGALYKISSQDPHMSISKQDLLVSLELLGLFTGALYKISSQDLYERALYKNSLPDLFTGPPYETSLYKISWYPWTF